MIPSDLTKDIKTRLSSIKGQVEGIVKMLDNDKDPEQILHQFTAVDQALQKARYLLLDDTYRKALAISIVATVAACPGNCGDEEKIQYIQEQFPNFKMTEITSRLKEIKEIQERISSYNASIDESKEK